MTNKYSYIYGSQTFRSLIKFSLIDIVKDSFVFIKNSPYAYISPDIDKTLPKLCDEKE